LQRRTVPLDPHRRHHDAYVAEASANDVQDVAQGRAAGRCDDADRPGKRGNRTLPRLIEQSLGFEPLLELLERELERAQPLGLHEPDHQLVLAAGRVYVEPAKDENLEPVLGHESYAPPATAEQHTPELRQIVLQREVRVARRRHTQVADLALDPDSRKRILEPPFDPRGELGHGQHRAFTHDAYLSSPCRSRYSLSLSGRGSG